MVEIARLFGQGRIILWGGVHAENLRAIKYYEKLGFERVGSFTTGDGIDCYDMMFKL
jgi:RimJ/RimL family protein N-acetyltransferase